MKWLGEFCDWIYEIKGIIICILIGFMLGDIVYGVLKTKDRQPTLIDIKRGHKVIAFAIDSNDKIWFMTKPLDEGEKPRALQFTDGKRTRTVIEVKK